MKKDRNTSAEAAELRRRAEARLQADRTKGPPARTEPETQRLVHELQVRQIELEILSEELWQSRAEAEAGLEHYTELYDFAPVGYLTLGRDGAISNVNLASADMLGVERARLVGRHFGVFVGEPDKDGFQAFLEKVFASQAKEVCEVALRKEGKGPLNVHITATVSNDGQECRLMMEDITKRRRAEAESQRALEYAENIVETVREPLVVLNSNLEILTANHSFYDTFKVTPEETIGNFIYDLGNRQWDIPKLRVLFEEILPHDTVFNGYEVEHDFLNIGRKIILLNARQIFRENIGSHIILLAMEDITERKRDEKTLQEKVAELHQALDQIKTLRGIVPICANCKKIRDDQGFWNQVEVYVRDHTEAKFSHGICPECMKKLYPELEQDHRSGPKN